MGLNPMNFMQQLQSFAQTVKGDPQQQVQQLVQSGQMSQSTYGSFANIAQMICSGDANGAISKLFGSR